MPPQDASLRGALCPRGADVVRAEHIEQSDAHDSQVQRDEEKREGDPGQHHVTCPVSKAAAENRIVVERTGEICGLPGQPAVAARGRDVPPIPGERLQHDADHDRVRRDPDQRDREKRLVEPRSRTRCGEHRRRNREHYDQHDAAERQPAGHCRRANHLRSHMRADQLVVGVEAETLVGDAEVAVECPPDELRVLRRDRPVDAQPMPRLRDHRRRRVLRVDQKGGRLLRDREVDRECDHGEHPEQDDADQDPAEEIAPANRHQRTAFGSSTERIDSPSWLNASTVTKIATVGRSVGQALNVVGS